MHDRQRLWSAPAERGGDGGFVREARCQRVQKRGRRFEQHGRRFALRTASLAPAVQKLHRLESVIYSRRTLVGRLLLSGRLPKELSCLAKTQEQADDAVQKQQPRDGSVAS